MFQKTIVSKYLLTQDKSDLNTKWDLFRLHFHNPEIQENIRNSKEEQYQEGFLRDLFVMVFGYILNPIVGYNLTTEHKNIKDSKKVDGAIIIDGKTVGVIELKGTNTTDLGKVEEQAFNYKNNQKGCMYVITSNFEKLRLYVDDSVTFVEFNLFKLTQDDFNLLYLLLSYNNVKDNIPKRIKDESLNQEDIVTQKLYKDYSVFKRELFQNLILLNPDRDPLELFQKSQKLLDRLLFLLFGEDRGLLPPNSVRQILEQWDKLKDLDEYVPLYNRYKKYFGYLNTGFKGKNHDVFAYNGGLFKEDEVLDNIKIDDNVLYDHTFRLSQYDFASEVDVNILGHIFENSLNEIDEIKSQIGGREIDKSKTKRKRDGVFYTPKYITKYIVENTVGKVCNEKKNEFEIIEADYFNDKKRQQKTKEKLLNRLNIYRDWLLHITVIDPACGSGAFLNETLNFLILEHQYIDELESKLLNVPIIFSYHSESILENNLFGVDLNDESVEIAKLSLWLRTAEPNRKLNSLNNNIKCGNSLIDKSDIVGDKAFNWKEEFPKVFEKGGFDVVIGNPPYVLCQPSNTDIKTLDFYKGYEVSSYKIDLFHLFFERSLNILKSDGKLGFITPNTYLTNKYIQKLRNFILCNSSIDSIVNYNDVVFVDAGVDVCTIILSKTKYENHSIKIYNSKNGLVDFVTDKDQRDWELDNDKTFNLNQSLEVNFSGVVPLGDICSVTFGLQTKDKSTYVSNDKRGEEWENCYTGKDVNRYFLHPSSLFFKNKIQEVKAGGSWDMKIHKSKKIVVRQVGNPEPIFAYDKCGFPTLNTMYSIVNQNDQFDILYLLSILNSKLIKSYWMSSFNDNKELFPKIKGFQLKQIPIKNIELEFQYPLIEKSHLMITLHEELQKLSGIFRRSLEREFSLEVLSKKLQNWYQLSYNDFLKELQKQKVDMTLSQKGEWEQFFNQEKEKSEGIQKLINTTDREIDIMVFQLYGLTQEEREKIGLDN